MIFKFRTSSNYSYLLSISLAEASFRSVHGKCIQMRLKKFDHNRKSISLRDVHEMSNIKYVFGLVVMGGDSFSEGRGFEYTG